MSFSSPSNLSQSSTGSTYPVLITAGANTVYAAWSETICTATCVKQIYYRRSTDGGVSFSAAATTSLIPTSIEDSDSDIYGLNLYLIYQESGIISFMKGS